MRVTVVIPSYNHGPYVEEAVASALAVPWDDLEVVVVDDGSSDDSVDRLRSMTVDPRLAIHTQANQGAHAALNRGLELATGRFVCILNSDDVFAPDRIPRLVGRLEGDPSLAMACSWLRVIDGDGDELGVKQAWRNMPPWPPPVPGPSLNDLGEPDLAMLQTNFVSTTSNVVFRRELVAEHGLRFAPLRYAHDWDFILAACAHGGLLVEEAPLVSYRVHGANTIAEGVDDPAGTGLMRFEIMWVTSRHAAAACRRAVDRGGDRDDLRRRMWRSLPRFGRDRMLAQLLLLRGDEAIPPAGFDAMLDPDHPWRRAAIDVLGSS